MPYPYYPYQNYYSSYPVPAQAQQATQNQQAMQQSAQQIQPVQRAQNGFLVYVNSEDEARRYPVAPGNTVTFKDEVAGCLYEKTMGTSQLDQPLFVIWDLTKRTPEPVQGEVVVEQYAMQDDLNALSKGMEDLRMNMSNLEAQLAGMRNDLMRIEQEPVKAKTTTRK